MRHTMFAVLATAVVTLLLAAPAAHAVSVGIDFEGLNDVTPVGTSYSSLGVEFFNATVLTAGISLNEFEYPPSSGSKVAFDDGAPISLVFDEAVTEFEVSITYAAPVTVSFYDGHGDVIATQSSLFNSNLASSGDPGSSPNELFSFSATGVPALGVVIAGNPGGSSLTIDDVAFAPVPEPSAWLVFAAGGLLVARRVRSAPPA